MANTTQQMMDMRQLMQGFNAMQAQAGLMPGSNFQQTQQFNQQPQQQQFQYNQTHPSQASDRLRVQYLQNMQMNAVTPTPMMGSMSPIRRQTQFEQAMHLVPPDLPQARFGSGAMMARQRAITSTNEDIAMMQSGAGLGLRAGGLMASSGMGAAMAGPFGPMGSMAGAVGYEHLGVGQRLQDFGSSMMTPIVMQRQRALQLQNMTMGSVMRGGDLSAAGMGLSATASHRLSSGLMQMADERGFQAETGGAFNRQDVMKITRLANEMGMLDQAQNTDQIKNSVRTISKSLKNFMDVMENPDMQEAMQMMGQLRDLGMNMPQTQNAAMNARMFARMAGTTAEGVMQAGMTGAAAYQARGLSGATGLQAGMAATGMGGAAASILSPRQLALAGGKEGVAQAFTDSALRAGTIDALLPGMVTRGAGGALTVDSAQLEKIMSGEVSMQDAMRKSASNMRRFGAEGAIQEFSTRKTELQDQIQEQLGPEGQMMFPLMQARMLMKDVPGMELGGALSTLAERGLIGEKQARTLEQMAQSPDFYNTLRQQRRVREREQGRLRREERRRIQEEADISAPRRFIEDVGGRFGRRVTGAFDRVGDIFAEQQDMEEALALEGGELGRTIRADSLGSDVQSENVRRLGARDGTGFMKRLGRDKQEIDRRIEREAQSPLRGSVTGNILREFHGPQGFGFTALGRGGHHMDQILDRQDDRNVLERVLRPRAAADVEADVSARIELGSSAQRGASASMGRQRELDKQIKQSTGLAGEALLEAQATASSSVKDYIRNKKGFFGGTGSLDPREMKEQVLKDMKDQGVPEDTLNALRHNQAFWDKTFAVVNQDDDPDVKAGVAKLMENADELRGVKEARTIDRARELAQERREGIFETLGIDTGFLSGVSNEQQTAVLDVLSETGEFDEERQMLVAAKALRAAGEGKRADVIEQRVLSKLPAEKAEELRKEVNKSAKNIGKDTLSQMGNTLKHIKDDNMLKQGLSQMGKRATEAAAADSQAEVMRILGEDTWSAISGAEDQAAALKKHVEEQGIDSIKDSEIRKLVEEGDFEEAIKRTGEKASGRSGSRERRSDVSRAVSAMAGGPFGTMLDVLQSTFTDTDKEPKKDKGKPKEPKSFEEAVPMFSEASSKLLKAAEAMEGSNSVSALGNIAGSAMGAVPGMGPLTGFLNLFRGD